MQVLNTDVAFLRLGGIPVCLVGLSDSGLTSAGKMRLRVRKLCLAWSGPLHVELQESAAVVSCVKCRGQSICPGGSCTAHLEHVDCMCRVGGVCAGLSSSAADAKFKLLSFTICRQGISAAHATMSARLAPITSHTRRDMCYAIPEVMSL